jgi:hypothetical protein
MYLSAAAVWEVCLRFHLKRKFLVPGYEIFLSSDHPADFPTAAAIALLATAGAAALEPE